MSDIRSTTLTPLNRVRVDSKRAPFLITTLLIVLMSMVGSILPSGVANAATRDSHQQLSRVSFKLDGVTLSLSSAFLPGKFTVSSSDNMIQMASSVVTHPYQEFQIEAVPYNVAPPLEALPIAAPGEAGSYRSLLHQYRATHGGHFLANPSAITLFGKQIQGEANLVKLNLDGSQPQNAIVTEYVTEAGSRLWLIRMTRGLATQDLGHQAASAISTAFLRSLATVNLSSSTLNASSTLITSLSQTHPQSVASGATPKATRFDLPFPSWWSGVCNYNNFLRDTGWQAWQMNSGLNGVYPCGPRPWAGGPDHTVHFYSGSWGALEFECVELALRWMYLDWGTPPYPGNGKDMVSNFAVYNSSSIIKEVYNSPGCCLVPEPGDVLSYCSTCSAGHTSVVLSTSVDGNGNGSITVMEENGTHNGLETLTVSNYEVLNTSAGWVYGWLHNFG